MTRAAWFVGGALGAVLAAGFSTSTHGALVKVNDRKFPVGTFCPLESRAAAGADLSFVAGGPAARVTFAVDNLKGFCSLSGAPCLSTADCPQSPQAQTCNRECSGSFTACTTDGDCATGERCGTWSELLLDNVTVAPKSVFDASLLSPSPFYEDCYFTTTPPGQTSGGMSGAPSYNHVAGGPESFLELFDSQAAAGAWSGDARFVASRSAPRNPAGPESGDLDETGGSLGVGTPADGHRPVSASLLVTGLTPGQQYVLFGWWSMSFADRMTLTIEQNACIDSDHDGYVNCNGCVRAAGETCGDCNDAAPHCTTSCNDADQDGWCPPVDCDDTASTCQADCATDLDADGIPFCRDTCEDPDGDHYGTAGGGGNTCNGSDCLELNPYCNVSCTDGDGDGACVTSDCDDANPTRHPGAVEINDCADQQCPGDLGYGVKDETSGNSGFLDPSKDRYSWPAQQNATLYQAIRSSTPDFSSGCAFFTSSATLWDDPTTPAAGQTLYYMNRPLLPCSGSWGQDSLLVERAVCPGEICTNGVDDDADGATDCADADCAAHASCQPHVFSFTDGPDDDIATTAFRDFLQPLTVGAGDYFYFQIVEQGWGRDVRWCAANAAFYRTSYLSFAMTGGSADSGAWNRWYRGPVTGNAWAGPYTASLVNEYGDFSFGEGSWCSEQFPTEPRNCLFPDRTNDCEAYDLTTGACAVSGGEPWIVTIRIGPTRLAACGF